MQQPQDCQVWLLNRDQANSGVACRLRGSDDLSWRCPTAGSDLQPGDCFMSAELWPDVSWQPRIDGFPRVEMLPFIKLSNIQRNQGPGAFVTYFVLRTRSTRLMGRPRMRCTARSRTLQSFDLRIHPSRCRGSTVSDRLLQLHISKHGRRVPVAGRFSKGYADGAFQECASPILDVGAPPARLGLSKFQCGPILPANDRLPLNQPSATKYCVPGGQAAVGLESRGPRFVFRFNRSRARANGLAVRNNAAS
jgi:hypothetical protein